MTNVQITQIVVALAAIASVSLFLWLVLVPSVAAREGFWQRFLAGALSVYLFAVMAAVGVAAGIGVIWAWPRLA
jgi:hypothetical protein